MLYNSEFGLFASSHPRSVHTLMLHIILLQYLNSCILPAAYFRKNGITALWVYDLFLFAFDLLAGIRFYSAAVLLSSTFRHDRHELCLLLLLLVIYFRVDIIIALYCFSGCSSVLLFSWAGVHHSLQVIGRDTSIHLLLGSFSPRQDWLMVS